MIGELLRELLILGYTKEESYSLIAKLHLLSQYGFLSRLETNGKTFTILDILKINSFPLTEVISLVERVPVSKKTLPKTIVPIFSKSLGTLTPEVFLSYFREYSYKKKEGQFFTPKELVHKVYTTIVDQIKNNFSSQFSVIDFSAGSGDFLYPFLSDDSFSCYAVELDPLIFDYLLFRVLFDPFIPLSSKLKTILTFKHGDSLLGFNRLKLEEILTDTVLTQQFNEIVAKRKLLLYDKKELTISEVINLLYLERKFRLQKKSLKQFNWFIDFPEIFADNKQGGFDFVIGNPPWLSFRNFNKKKYSEIFSFSPFSDILHGKYNYSLPFFALAFYLSKKSGFLILPKGILTESYAHKIRKKLADNASFNYIELLNRIHFKTINNEFCLLSWVKEQPKHVFSVIDKENNFELIIPVKGIRKPSYKIPLIPARILEAILKITEDSATLQDLCTIRRGLTLTKKYQSFVQNTRNINNKEKITKQLIRHNFWAKNRKTGIFNFQIFYSGEKFLYLKDLLGAPGDEEVFEQAKIIRRNRGQYWFVGLDKRGEYYVNDLFDIIIPKLNRIDLFSLFGYLSSSLIQFLAEGFLQRDITSNHVRFLPSIRLTTDEYSALKNAVKVWLESNRTKSDAMMMRKAIDSVVYTAMNLPDHIQNFIEEKTHLHS
ncbi:MAG: Eco57I restriction-modification methylase domain-containing protein [Candidatus Heimdallarchaeaceae archaeon]